MPPTPTKTREPADTETRALGGSASLVRPHARFGQPNVCLIA